MSCQPFLSILIKNNDESRVPNWENAEQTSLASGDATKKITQSWSLKALSRCFQVFSQIWLVQWKGIALEGCDPKKCKKIIRYKQVWDWPLPHNEDDGHNPGVFGSTGLEVMWRPDGICQNCRRNKKQPLRVCEKSLIKLIFRVSNTSITQCNGSSSKGIPLNYKK